MRRKPRDVQRKSSEPLWLARSIAAVLHQSAAEPAALLLAVQLVV